MKAAAPARRNWAAQPPISVSDSALRPIWQALRKTSGRARPRLLTAPLRSSGVSSSRFSSRIAERFGSGARNPPWPVKCQPSYAPLASATRSSRNVARTGTTCRPPSASERTYSPSLVARGSPESRGRTKARFLSDRVGLNPIPGSHRVIANASHRNGPSTTRPFARPCSLHSSQGIHGSSDCTCTTLMRSRSCQSRTCKVRREELLEQHGPLGRQPLLHPGLVLRIGHGQALDVLEELLEVLEGVGAERHRAEQLEVELQSGIRRGEPEGQGRLTVALVL